MSVKIAACIIRVCAELILEGIDAVNARGSCV